MTEQYYDGQGHVCLYLNCPNLTFIEEFLDSRGINLLVS